jgi:hypothetical protein
MKIIMVCMLLLFVQTNKEIKNDFYTECEKFGKVKKIVMLRPWEVLYRKEKENSDKDKVKNIIIFVFYVLFYIE